MTPRLAAAAAVLLLGAVPVGPASGQGAQSRPPRRAPQQGPGTLEGTVRLDGSALPRPTRVQNTTDPEVCGREHSLEDLMVAPEDRGIRHVIVSLAGVSADRIPSPSPRRLVIDNRDCRFVPHAAVATVGDSVVARNSDATLHNTHYYGPMRSNVALPREGMAVTRVARVPGLVTVLCDVHGWMRAYIRIDPHPFHAVTDGQGRFRIDGVPPGRYTLELWHEKLGSREVEVEVTSGRTTTLGVVYPAPGG